MSLSRREWIALASLGALVRPGSARRALAQGVAAPAPADRIANVIREYEAQGFHRTGTEVDRVSGDWLAGQVRQAGLEPHLESFQVNRVDLVTTALIVGSRRIEGVPLFDGSFTGSEGLSGRLGGAETDADIALSETAVNASGAGALGDLRRANRHKAIVAITRGRRPGLCPSNADSFLRPFGPPVLQVSSEEATDLAGQAKRGADVQLLAQVTRTPVMAYNVTATLPGTDAQLPPMVVMTPRSGWYTCASERGGGIACWLEIMRGLRMQPQKRTVLFVASSGHELGHLGIDAYIERRPGVVKQAIAWLHLGANIGAATEPANTLQASEDGLDAMLTSAMSERGLRVNRRNPRGTVPGGEAEAVHRGGGRYVSVIGGNALFHNLDDRGPQAVDSATIATFGQTFLALVQKVSEAV